MNFGHPFINQERGKPFAVNVRSVSPLTGCLLFVAILVVGALVVAGAGVVALFGAAGLLVWRLVRLFLPGSTMEPTIHETHAEPGVIDVEATVLPPAIQDGQSSDTKQQG